MEAAAYPPVGESNGSPGIGRGTNWGGPLLDECFVERPGGRLVLSTQAGPHPGSARVQPRTPPFLCPGHPSSPSSEGELSYPPHSATFFLAYQPSVLQKAMRLVNHPQKGVRECSAVLCSRPSIYNPLAGYSPRITIYRSASAILGPQVSGDGSPDDDARAVTSGVTTTGAPLVRAR